MRKYGVLIGKLELARKEYKAKANQIRQELFPEMIGQRTSLNGKQVECLWWAHRSAAQSWVSTAMNAPLLFIGLGMGREEWPLWWFLNQRARNHARRSLQVRTFVFMERSEALRLKTAAELTGLTLLVFNEFGEGWNRLFTALGI
jgi:hypothetical protein